MQPFSLTIPATAANLGPGFDSLGLALTMHNTFILRPATAFHIDVTGYGKDILADIHSNSVISTYSNTCKQHDWEPLPFALENCNAIPLESGLGSSATAIVAGVAAAHFIHQGHCDKDAVLRSAVFFENHPDNIVPAIFGGFNASCLDEHDPTTVYNLATAIPSSLGCLAVYPHVRVATAASRQQLPTHLALGDAVYSLARAALLTNAFVQHKWEAIAPLMQDKIHEPYRDLFGLRALRSIVQQAGGYAACISGSGPTVICFHPTSVNLSIPVTEFFLGLGYASSAFPLIVDNAGLIVQTL